MYGWMEGGRRGKGGGRTEVESRERRTEREEGRKVLGKQRKGGRDTGREEWKSKWAWREKGRVREEGG